MEKKKKTVQKLRQLGDTQCCCCNENKPAEIKNIHCHASWNEKTGFLSHSITQWKRTHFVIVFNQYFTLVSCKSVTETRLCVLSFPPHLTTFISALTYFPFFPELFAFDPNSQLGLPLSLQP